MITLVNYNKGATIVASRNIQLIAVVFIFIAPVIFNELNDRLFHLPDVISTYIMVAVITSGIVMYVLNFVLLAFTMLSFKPLKRRSD